MRNKISWILQTNGITGKKHDDILEPILYLIAENETGVSDSLATHGDLPLVRKSECEANESDKLTGEAEHGTLENRIDSENLCVECGERPSVVIAWCRECMIEYNRKIAKEKES